MNCATGYVLKTVEAHYAMKMVALSPALLRLFVLTQAVLQHQFQVQMVGLKCLLQLKCLQQDLGMYFQHHEDQAGSQTQQQR
jgi:hypothetical protein